MSGSDVGWDSGDVEVDVLRGSGPASVAIGGGVVAAGAGRDFNGLLGAIFASGFDGAA
ncbi:hypothetical protein [Paraburkholderia sp. GAS41]|uniref:hypothetical protein n=1 Tax=Paraburkholderia sp. GAS41 TaxID=3035134 RepID=UPI003D1A56C9